MATALVLSAPFAIGPSLSASAQTGAPHPAPAREMHAELPVVRLWFRDTGGNGVPVVLLHATTGSSQVWEHQIPAFTAAGYRVVAY